MKKGIIIGAGIGGLTTAIALAKKGISVDIYEQAAELKAVGAGIMIAPNGLKVFEALGMAKEVIDSGWVLEKAGVVDLNFKPITMIDAEKFNKKYGFQTIAIHRGALQKVLTSNFRAGQIFLNKKFQSYTPSETDVTVTFEDGTVAQADFLILADGIKSRGRVQMQKNAPLRYSGQTCWRFVTDLELPKNEMYEIWAEAKGLRVGYAKINKKQVYVFITNSEKEGGKDDISTIKTDLLKLCSDFPSIVKMLINSVDEKDIIRTDLFDFEPMKNWTDGRVVLLGDAAHATTPNLGQGACQAIEDAYFIAQAMHENTAVATAFKVFQSKRIQKATYITNTSWQFAQLVNTSGWLKKLIIGLIRLTPKSVSEKQFDKIYRLNGEV